MKVEIEYQYSIKGSKIVDVDAQTIADSLAAICNHIDTAVNQAVKEENWRLDYVVMRDVGKRT